MQRIEHRDHDAVFMASKVNSGWIVVVSGYDLLKHPVTERIYCVDIQDVKLMVDQFYDIPIIQRNL